MDVKNRLKDSGFKFSKNYGQNFITDKNLLDAIVRKSGVESTDTVVEIGAGAGTLTGALARRAKRVVAYEIDAALKPTLLSELEEFDNVELRFGDFMKEEDVSATLGTERYKVVANLPYYITTPILFRLIENTAVAPESISVMVQREVADRLCARPSCKDYGALTVAIDLRYEAKKIMDVSREMFYPVPNVDSAVVLMTRRGGMSGVDEKFFSRFVGAAFAMRRKTLVNNLTAAFGLSRAECESALCDCGLSLTVRGEALSTEQFKTLSRRLLSASPSLAKK